MEHNLNKNLVKFLICLIAWSKKQPIPRRGFIGRSNKLESPYTTLGMKIWESSLKRPLRKCFVFCWTKNQLKVSTSRKRYLRSSLKVMKQLMSTSKSKTLVFSTNHLNSSLQSIGTMSAKIWKISPSHSIIALFLIINLNMIGLRTSSTNLISLSTKASKKRHLEIGTYRLSSISQVRSTNPNSGCWILIRLMIGLLPPACMTSQIVKLRKNNTSKNDFISYNI